MLRATLDHRMLLGTKELVQEWVRGAPTRLYSMNLSVLFSVIYGWRRGWDSNPRAGYPTTRFRGAPVTTTSVPLRRLEFSEADLSLYRQPAALVIHRLAFDGPP